MTMLTAAFLLNGPARERKPIFSTVFSFRM